MTTDVVFTFSFESFEDAVGRGMCRPPDRLLSTLLRDDRVDRLVVADPYRSGPVRLLRHLSGTRIPRPDRPGVQWVRPLRLRRHDPVRLSALEQAYGRYEGQLERAATRGGLASPAVITFNPFVAAFCDFGWAGGVTYYARDDWTTYPVQHRFKQAHEVAIERIRDRARGVCAVSDVLLQRIAPVGPSIVVPNGIDPAEWQGDPKVPAWFRKLPRPVAVYAGSIDGRLDLGAVTAAARAVGRGSVVLMGPILDVPLSDALSRLPNVHLPGPQGRAHVAGMVRDSDVCLIPHVRNELTEAMSPIKLFEYQAGGRPVVATDLPPIRRAAERTVLVPDGASWGEAVERALELGPLDESARQAYVAAHSWRSRHDDVLGLALRPNGDQALAC